MSPPDSAPRSVEFTRASLSRCRARAASYASRRKRHCTAEKRDLSRSRHPKRLLEGHSPSTSCGNGGGGGEGMCQCPPPRVAWVTPAASTAPRDERLGGFGCQSRRKRRGRSRKKSLLVQKALRCSHGTLVGDGGGGVAGEHNDEEQQAQQKCSDCQATARRAGASERLSLDRGRRAASTEARRSAEPAITMARILETSRPRSQHENLFPSPSKYLCYSSSVSPPLLRYIAPVKNRLQGWAFLFGNVLGGTNYFFLQPQQSSFRSPRPTHVSWASDI